MLQFVITNTETGNSRKQQIICFISLHTEELLHQSHSELEILFSPVLMMEVGKFEICCFFSSLLRVANTRYQSGSWHCSCSDTKASDKAMVVARVVISSF